MSAGDRSAADRAGGSFQLVSGDSSTGSGGAVTVTAGSGSEKKTITKVDLLIVKITEVGRFMFTVVGKVVTTLEAIFLCNQGEA